MRKGGLDALWNEIVARYLAMAAKSKPAPVPDGKVEPASTLPRRSTWCSVRPSI